MEIIQNIKKRVDKDKIEISGRTFVLKKFDPLLGNYIIMKLFTEVLPFGLSKSIGESMEGAEAISIETNGKTAMSKKAFLEFQVDILGHCFEQLPAGEAPVVRENGTYGIENFTSKIAVQLLIATIMFNFNDFFEGSQSKEKQEQGK